MQAGASYARMGEPGLDLLDYRAEFPILANKTFLNTCSLGALSTRSIAGVHDFLDRWAELGASAWYELWVGKLAELRTAYAQVIGVGADRIALAPSISVAISSVASALEYTGRKKIVVADLDFPTIGHQFLAKRRQGVNVQFVKSPDKISIPLDLFDQAIDNETALVATSHVYFTSGAIQDVRALAQIAHAKGALLLVDGYQATGQIPVDVLELGVDFYTSGSLKWLLGGPGIAFLYVSERVGDLEPSVTGWWGMGNMFDFDISSLVWREEAARFEMGTPSMASVYAALGGLSIINDIGVDRIRTRSVALTEDLIMKAADAGFQPRVASDAGQRTPIVLLECDDPRLAVAALARMGIVVDSRPGAVRISPFFYNTAEENEIAVSALRNVTGSSRLR